MVTDGRGRQFLGEVHIKSEILRRLFAMAKQSLRRSQLGRVSANFSVDHKPLTKPNPTRINIVVAPGRDIPGSQLSRQLLPLKIPPKKVAFDVGCVSRRVRLRTPS